MFARKQDSALSQRRLSVLAKVAFGVSLLIILAYHLAYLCELQTDEKAGTRTDETTSWKIALVDAHPDTDDDTVIETEAAVIADAKNDKYEQLELALELDVEMIEDSESNNADTEVKENSESKNNDIDPPATNGNIAVTADWESIDIEEQPQTSPAEEERQNLTVFMLGDVCSDCSKLDWVELSKNLCPHPPELESFFTRIYDQFVKQNSSEVKAWQANHAPCHFWQKNALNRNFYTCANDLEYVITSDYSDWLKAYVVVVESPAWLSKNNGTSFNASLLPPRRDGQVWWLKVSDDISTKYPFLTSNEFRDLFDLTFESPGQFFSNSANQDEADVMLTDEAISELYKTHVAADQKRGDLLIAANCGIREHHGDYFKELQMLTDVEIVGECHDIEPMPDDFDGALEEHVGVRRLLRKNDDQQNERPEDGFALYKFVMVFETGNKVTSDIYAVMRHDAIPLYMGPSHVDDYVPTNSIIKTTDFKSPRHLLDYIEELATKKDLYDQYFSWKNVESSAADFCKKCRIKAEPEQIEREYETLCRLLEHV